MIQLVIEIAEATVICQKNLVQLLAIFIEHVVFLVQLNVELLFTNLSFIHINLIFLFLGLL